MPAHPVEAPSGWSTRKPTAGALRLPFRGTLRDLRVRSARQALPATPVHQEIQVLPALWVRPALRDRRETQPEVCCAQAA